MGRTLAGTVGKPSACFLDNTKLRYDLECVHKHAFLGLGLGLTHSVFLGTVCSGMALHGTCLYSWKNTILCCNSRTKKRRLR